MSFIVEDSDQKSPYLTYNELTVGLWEPVNDDLTQYVWINGRGIDLCFMNCGTIEEADPMAWKGVKFIKSTKQIVLKNG